jgi:Tol biopolymer transport system component/DNA-binding winged helix-turn-helix (wHTH) protein
MPSLNPSARSIRFGNFEIDAANRELRNRGRVVRLQPKPFAVLLLLARRSGQVVSREDIRTSVWEPDTFVDFERSINFAINQIRAALRDNADKPRFIETVPRLGYRFLPAVEVVDTLKTETSATNVVESPSSNAPRQSDTPPPEADAATVEASPTQVSTPIPAPDPRQPNWTRLTVVLAAVLLAGLALLGWLTHTRPFHRQQMVTAGTAATRTRTVPVTSFAGVMGDPIFSPDGKQIAFTWDGKDHKQSNIYTLPIGGDQPYQVTHFGPEAVHLAWSPDGQTIAYSRCHNHDGVIEGGIYAVPALAGPERKLTSILAGISCEATGIFTPQFTPDGQFLIIGDRCGTTAPMTFAIAILSLATGQRRCLTTPPTGIFDMYPRLSPDGTKVAFVRVISPQVGDYYVVPFTGGPPLRLTTGELFYADPMWSPDSSRIMFRSGHHREFGDQLVSVPANGGEIKPEPVYPSLGVMSPDGRHIAFTASNGEQDTTIWRVLLSGAGSHVLSHQELIHSPGGDDSPQLSPDGAMLAFASSRSGSGEVWVSDADGNNPQQLTNYGAELVGCPRWSPDGKRLIYDRRPAAVAQLWVMDADGRDQHALMSIRPQNDDVPSYSRDGQYVYLRSLRSGSLALWKQHLTPDGRSADGPPVQISKLDGFSAFESYDGKTIYFARGERDGVWSLPVRGGTETRVTSAPLRGQWGYWAVTDSGLYMLDCHTKPHCTLEFYNFSTRKVSSLFQIEQELPAGQPGLTASRDGKTVLYSQFVPGNNFIAMTEILP